MFLTSWLKLKPKSTDSSMLSCRCVRVQAWSDQTSSFGPSLHCCGNHFIPSSYLHHVSVFTWRGACGASFIRSYGENLTKVWFWSLNRYSRYLKEPWWCCGSDVFQIVTLWFNPQSHWAEITNLDVTCWERYVLPPKRKRKTRNTHHKVSNNNNTDENNNNN